LLKRLVLSFAALVAAAGPLALAPSDAFADRKDGRGNERRIERQDRRDDRRIERRDDRLERRGFNGRDDRRPPPTSGRGREVRGYGPPPSQWRWGATLPSGYRGVRIYAYDRHRLRPPPPGYAWYQVGEDYLLTQTVTGMIVEVVPGY
jgi:Ni/Co efflux regulator RcnB